LKNKSPFHKNFRGKKKEEKTLPATSAHRHSLFSSSLLFCLQIPLPNLPNNLSDSQITVHDPVAAAAFTAKLQLL
jgi:hypothetical protein